MSNPMVELFQYILAYVGVAVLIFFVLNFLTKGYIWMYLRVKASQGKKILVRLNASNKRGYSVGKYEEGFLVFKNLGKQQMRHALNSAAYKELMFQEMGVDVIEFDEIGNKCLKTDFTVAHFTVGGSDNEVLFQSYKNMPKSMPKKDQIILAIIILTFLAILFIGWQVLQLHDAIAAIGSLTGNI
jgi:hypothetical protein